MRAAFYECDITPPLGGLMWGHYEEVRGYDVYDKLYAKAVVVEDQGEVAAIVVVDTCVLPEGIHEVVTKRIQEFTGIAPERVCITSNHTHSGAPVSSDPAIGCFADETYKDVFFRLCADAVTLAYKRLDTVEAKFGCTEVTGIAFNRDFLLTDGTIVTHGRGRTNIERPFGETDPALPVLMFYQDGKPIGAIINYACHQCCLNSLYKQPGYSGDYASALSAKLKEHYGNDFVSLFVLGTCGDINHVDPNRKDPMPAYWYRHMGEVLAEGVIRAMENAQPVPGGVGVIAEIVEIERRPSDGKTVMDLLKGRVERDGERFLKIRNMVYYNAANKKKSTALMVQGIRIGDVLISALPGEVFVAIGKGIKAGSPFQRNMVVENSNTYCGYIPTEEAFCENSDLYEITLCMHSCHVPEAGTILKNKALEIAKKLADGSIK